MGKFSNLILIAAAAGLVVVGVAAQVGGISSRGHNTNAHGAVEGVIAQPVKPPTQPQPPTYIDTAPAPAEQTQPAPVVAPSIVYKPTSSHSDDEEGDD